MGHIEDTSKRHPVEHLGGLLAEERSSGYIENMEAAGQAQLLTSMQVPSKMKPDRAAYEALGFSFGEETDDLFITAKLPEGWTREGSDHAMWSYIVDGSGHRRVAIFYKAAFYDRRAFMCLEDQL